MNWWDNLRKKRVDCGYTIREMAEILNVSCTDYNSWEKGEAEPDLDIMVVVSDLFDCTLDVLLRGEEYENSNCRHISLRQ